MNDRPKMDYDPGPVRASYSRVGPPTPRLEPFHYEVAEEIEPVPERTKGPGKTSGRQRYNGAF